MLVGVTELFGALPGQSRFKWMAWRPPNLAGKPIRTTAEGRDRIREKECLSDRDHFGPKALLGGSIPESREIRRGERPGDDFHAGVLEAGDLRFDPFAQCSSDLIEDKWISLGKSGEHSGWRTDMANLDYFGTRSLGGRSP